VPLLLSVLPNDRLFVAGDRAPREEEKGDDTNDMARENWLRLAWMSFGSESEHATIKPNAASASVHSPMKSLWKCQLLVGQIEG
jgi:hypothetical protein